MQSSNALPSDQKFIGRRSLDELIKKLEQDKSLLMSNDFKETLNQVDEIITYKRMKIAQILEKLPQARSTSETQSLSPEAPSSGATSTYSEAPKQAALPEEHTTNNFEAVGQTLPPPVTTKRNLEMCDEEESEQDDSEMEDSSEEECQLTNWIVAGTSVRRYPNSRFCKKRSTKYTKRQRRVMPKNSL